MIKTLNVNYNHINNIEKLEYDYNCYLMSLPLAFKTKVHTIPNKTPYLFTPQNKKNYWKRKLGVNPGIIFLITLWISFEKFHLNWQFSWPWLNLGNAFSEKIEWIQWYEFTGSFGGTLWVLLINIGLFEVFKNHPPSLKNSLWVKKMSPWLIGIALPISISLMLYQSEKDLTPTTEVLLLQPNIDPYNEKYDKENNYYFDLMAHMTADHITEETRYIFTPETYFGAGFGASLEEFKTSTLHRKITNSKIDYRKYNDLRHATSKTPRKINTPKC